MLLPSGVDKPLCSSQAFLQMIAPMPRGSVLVHRLATGCFMMMTPEYLPVTFTSSSCSNS